MWGALEPCRNVNNDDNQIAIAKAGGIKVVVSIMQRHKDSAAVQEYACGALRNLACENDDNKIAIAKAGGIEAVVLAMQRHEDSAAVQEKACGALYELAAQR